MAEITIFEQYKPFFRDHYRFNVSYGGRGRGATWNIARGLLAESLTEKHRILCTREFQNSISESVYEVIVSQIALLGLDKYFNIQKTSIESVNGSEFIFKGLRHNVDSIKSMEGITRCWIAEADKVPQDSLDKLIPTVRTEGSKFYIDFNTDSVDDPIYKMLVESPRADTFVLFQTYADNKFFPEVLRSDLEHDKANDYDKYLWIWEGQPRAFSDACVFKGRYIVDDFKTPDDVEFFHGIDWGFAKDPTVAVRCFIKDDRLWVDQSVGGVGVDIDELSEMFDRIPTLRRWVSYADSSRPETISYMRKKGFPNMRPSLKGKGSVEDGIELLKGFEKIVIHPRCEGLIEEMKLYRYKVNSLTGDVMPVLEDKNNHCLTGDTLVHTIAGKVRIDELVGKEGLLYSYDDGLVVSRFFDVRKTRENADLVEVELEDGSTFRCTPDHLVLTTEGWVEAQDLTENSDVIDLNNALSYNNGMGKYIYFNGLKYTRDDKRGYHRNNATRKYLHQAVYEFYHGSIPDGYDVHHIDLDKGNNSIDNLVLVTRSEHLSLHGCLLSDEQRESRRNNFDENARPKAIEWHKSKEGRAWHKEHALRVAENMKERKYRCLNCGKVFYKKPFGENKFCSNACKSAYRRKLGIDNVTRNCPVCKKDYITSKYSKQETCSRSCSNRLRYMRLRNEG